MAQAPLPTLEKMIRSTGFYKQKAKSLKGTAAGLVARFNGEVPKTIAELTTLPGVARKTANVVLGTSFGIAEGMVVDTHIQRLSMRLALTRSTDAKGIEQDLMQVLPRDSWIRAGHQLIWHGRRVCFARKPNCAGCTLAPFCPSAGLES
jgi:endonuclease-3